MKYLRKYNESVDKSDYNNEVSEYIKFTSLDESMKPETHQSLADM